MTLIIPPGYAQTILRWSSTNFDTGQAVTTFGYGRELGADPVSLEEFATVIRGQVQGLWLPLMDSNTTLVSVEVFNETDGAILTSGSAGGRSGTATPPNVACLVTKNCPGRGRRRQGRMFVPSVLGTTEVQEDGFIAGARRTVIQTAFSTFFDEVTEEVPEGNFVILQNDEGNTPPISPPPIVTGFTVEAKVSTQRRRLRR